MSVINTHNLGQFWFIASTITHRFGVLERLTIPGVHLCVGHQHSQFWPNLPCFMEYYSLFCGPGVISMINKFKAGFRLCAGHQHSQFWSILPRFMDYYSLFWGPGAISTIDAPRGAFMCCPPTILVLFDSGLFHGLLLTILGSQSYFHD